MNNMSWFLYFVDALSNLQTVLALLLIFGTAAGGMASAFVMVEHNIKWPLFTLIPTIILLSIIAALIPSKQTMYMIAASEIGEQIASLEDVKAIGGDVGGLAQDTIALLRQNLQEQLAETE